MILTCALAAVLAFFAAPKLPFVIDASHDVSVNFPGAPRVASGAFGQWQGKWVFIGGRIAGYHGLGGSSADFLKSDANRDVWVVDSTVRPAHTYHAAIAELPAKLTPVKDEWQATSPFYYQDGKTLYIGGGYGQDSSGDWVTFPLLSAVDLPRLIDGVMSGHIPSGSIAFTCSPLVQSAGGEFIKLSDGFFYLVMGHVFTGNYTAFEGQSERNSAAVSQTYLNEIRKLKIDAGRAEGITVSLIDRFRDNQEFHRRDLNIARLFSRQGDGFGIYGGVFTPNTQVSYDKPIYLLAGGKPIVDSKFDQQMNTYNSAKLAMYDGSSDTMYTTFFGGISRHIWDSAAGRFLENTRTGSKGEPGYLDGMQWSDQVSTLARVMTESRTETIETVQPQCLPAFVGTSAFFILSEKAPRANPSGDIVDLRALRGAKRTLVAYLYGGIRAYPFRFPYTKTSPPYNSGTVPTEPSDLILEVFVNTP